ncbi:MAG: HAMP domain-containing protein [Alphaproteobacteria bacterium]|nr:HAMP domain-containing protein [Alphaproteobacteria bacterium]
MKVRRKGIMKRFLPRTLFGRSLIIVVAPIILLQMVTTYIFFDRHWNRMTGRLAFAVAGETAILADQFESDPPPETVQRIAGYASRNLELLIGFDRGGTLQTVDREHSGWDSIVASMLAGALENQVRRPFEIAVDIEDKWVSIGVQLTNGVLHVTLPQGRLFSSSGYIFLLWMFGTSIVLIVIAILFMRNQVRPIRRLAVAAERFGKGRDVPAFKPEGAHEVRQAARAFLEMHERVRRQIEQRTAMLAGVSHDLRTPLTRLKLQLAMLGDSPDVQACKADIEVMERMIQGYLDFARGEAGEVATRTDIARMLERLVAAAKREGADIVLSVQGDPGASIRPLAFERCLMNVVANARRFGTTVWINAAATEEAIEIAVDDNGPGVPEERYEDVFKPFFRLDSSRNVETGGVGLGLPIAMDVIHSHGGRIWLEKSKHGGLRVVMTVPR